MLYALTLDQLKGHGLVAGGGVFLYAAQQNVGGALGKDGSIFNRESQIYLKTRFGTSRLA